MVSGRRATAPVAVVVAAGLGALLFTVDPAGSRLFPPCIFHLTTGLQCPGCGLTRAVHLLFHGDLAGALALNSLLPLYALLLGALLAGWLWREVKGHTPRVLQIRASLITASGLTMIAFGVMRNLV